MLDVAIIGCGIVGAAAAFELSKFELKVAVLEKENDIAAGTTKANSAIIHAGFDPEPGTLSARLNVEGAKLAKEICKKLDVPYKQCGALVLAFSKEDLNTLEHLLENGNANGVPDLEIIAGDQAREMEPNLSGDVTAALNVPTTGIVSPWEYALALAQIAAVNGVEIMRQCKVVAVDKVPGGFKISTTQGSIEARYILNAAGLGADDIHNMIAEPAFEILPNRGEYYLLDKSEGKVVERVIFQCPSNRFKGVLVAPTVHGNLIIGPNSENFGSRDDFSTSAGGLSGVMNTAKKSVPGLNFRANIRNFAGLRAMTSSKDFIIEEASGAKGFINLAGIMSPGLSAAPAIAKMACELLKGSGLKFKEKQNFRGGRKKIRFHRLTQQEKAALVAENPAYGRVICRCETITEGEILDALNSPIPPLSIDGVKRRAGTGMGRCQGGFCSPRLLEILAKHYGCDPTDVLQDLAGTYILTSETKGAGLDI